MIFDDVSITCIFMLSNCVFQRGEAKLLIEDWEGAVGDLKTAAQGSPQVYQLTVFQTLLWMDNHLLHV